MTDPVALADLPKKDYDRQKPFKRINNDAFLVTGAVSADGVACGCHTPKDLGDMEEALRNYIKENMAVVGPLLAVFDKLAAVVKTISETLNSIIDSVKVLPGIGPILAGFFKGILSPVTDVANVFAQITAIIHDVLSDFMTQIGTHLAQRAVRLVPQWVPVKPGEAKEKITLDQIKEVEGLVSRSYGDPVGAPFTQWRRWLGWSIQVTPEPQYAKLVTADIATHPASADKGDTAIAHKGDFDIQWDAGALMQKSDTIYENGMDARHMPDADGPMLKEDTNWIWPMAGMYVWASGRWVFDCSRVDDPDAGNPKTCAIMNPPRALATAAWGAVDFPENRRRDRDNPDVTPASDSTCSVPAIQFMFVSSCRGGYIDHRADAAGGYEFLEDYQFIVDLPPLDFDPTPYPIATTPDLDHNKVVLRPRLLQKVDALRFCDGNRINPTVRLLPPDDPTKAPNQALVTVPAKSAIKPDDKATTDAVGFILSLGWHDPERIRAAQVRRCSVVMKSVKSHVKRDNTAADFRKHFAKEEAKLRKKIIDRVDHLTILGHSISELDNLNTGQKDIDKLAKQIHDAVNKAVDDAMQAFVDKLAELLGGFESDEYLMRIGVNGRWLSTYVDPVNLEKNAPFSKGETNDSDASPLVYNFDLGPDDPLIVAAGGAEFNAIGGMMRAALADRTLKIHDGEDVLKTAHPVTWAQIVNAKDKLLRDIVFAYTIEVMGGNGKRPLALGSENTALGFIDPGTPGQVGGRSNPLILTDLETRTFQFGLTPTFAYAADPEYSLFEKNKDDYDLFYTFDLKDRKAKAS